MDNLNMLGGSLGGLVGAYFQNEGNRRNEQLQRIQGQMGLSGAIRNRMLTEFDNRINQRRAEEGAAQSGVYDPSDPMNDGSQAVKRVTDRGNIALGGAQDQERLARSQLDALRHAIQTRRNSFYAQMGLHMLGAGMGAYGMWNQSGLPAGVGNAASTVAQSPMGLMW